MACTSCLAHFADEFEQVEVGYSRAAYLAHNETQSSNAVAAAQAHDMEMPFWENNTNLTKISMQISPQVHHCDPSSSACHVVVRNLAGENIYELDLSSTDLESATIDLVKQLICGSTAIPVDEQKLVLGLETFENSCRIADIPVDETSGELVLCLVRERAVYIATGGVDKKLCIWDLKRRQSKIVMNGHTDHVVCCSVHKKSHRLLSSSRDGMLRMWDYNTGICTQQVDVTSDYATCLAVDWETERALMGHSNGSLQLWDLATATLLQRLSCSNGQVSCIDVDWASMLVVSGHWDLKILLWDLKSGSSLRSQTRAGSVSSLVVNWAERAVLSGGADGSLWLSHMDNEMVQEMKGHNGRIVCVQANWDLQRAASASWDGTIRLWDLNCLQCLSKLGESVKRQMGHAGVPSCMTVDWITMHVVSGHRNGRIRLWDFEGKRSYESPNEVSSQCHELLDEWRAHQAPVLCMAFA